MINPKSVWQNEVQGLCYQIFFTTEAGKRLLDMLEQRYFYGPVAEPSANSNWAYFNEGRNQMIRQIRGWGQDAMMGKVKVESKTIKRKAK